MSSKVSPACFSQTRSKRTHMSPQLGRLFNPELCAGQHEIEGEHIERLRAESHPARLVIDRFELARRGRQSRRHFTHRSRENHSRAMREGFVGNGFQHIRGKILSPAACAD